MVEVDYLGRYSTLPTTLVHKSSEVLKYLLGRAAQPPTSYATMLSYAKLCSEHSAPLCHLRQRLLRYYLSQNMHVTIYDESSRRSGGHR